MKKVLTTFMMCVLLVSAARAAVATYTVSFEDAYEGTFNINKTLAVPQFDSSLGTLLNVSIDYGIAASGTIGFENTTANSYSGTIYTYYYWENPVANSTRGNLKLDFDSSTIASIAWDVREGYALSLTGFDGGYDFAGTSGFLTTYLNESDSGSLYYDSGLSGFIGDGSIDVTFGLVGDAWSAMVMPGNGMSQVRTLGSGDVTITYEYIIPEPATMLLLGLGGLLLRKRK